jgi:N-acylneuraminate cytidylyltransferase/CMP-N,N'-diacetyllegionaminic acid synthase
VKILAAPIVNRQQAPVVFSLSPAAFTVRVEALWRYEHWSRVERMNVHVIPRERAVDVDTELDLELVELLLRHRKRG